MWNMPFAFLPGMGERFHNLVKENPSFQSVFGCVSCFSCEPVHAPGFSGQDVDADGQGQFCITILAAFLISTVECGREFINPGLIGAASISSIHHSTFTGVTIHI
jgi:hypothetical protein